MSGRGLQRLLPGGSWLSAYALVYVVFLYLPVVFLPIFSINTAATPKLPLSGYTLKWYEGLPRTPELLDAAWNSLIVGVSASVLSTVFGILAARAITRYRFPGRRPINGLIMAPLVLPEVIVAISMLLVMLQLGLSLSLFTVVLGHVLVCIPYSMTVLTSGFEGFDRSLEEASGESLRQLAAWIRPGSLVLELGPASGYFTRFLREQLACTVDAVELDPDMAAKAAGWCRRMVVGNLEQIDFAASFADQRYDFVVVADVLEHLADPAQLLRRLSGVLRDDGELLVSVPNVAYAGLVASLLQGEFSFREEGLLDRTHLRFFTRASLQGLLAEAGFHVWEWRAVDRSLMDSEFRVRAETLAPALRSELLSQPNALCYQWLARVRSTPPVESPALPVSMTDAFPVRVFWAVDEEPFDFDRSVVGWGKVGEDPQTVSVALPASAGHLRVRLSDRPGYLHLFGCRVVGAEGSALFAWQPPEDVQHLVTASDGVGMHQDPACPDRISMLLHGDESWLDLAWRDVPAGACIEFSLGWPMSPDYLQASRGWIAEVGRAREQVEAVKQLVAERDALLSLRTRQMHQLEVRIHEQEQVAASQMQMLKKSQLTVDRAQDDGSRPVAGGGARGDGGGAEAGVGGGVAEVWREGGRGDGGVGGVFGQCRRGCPAFCARDSRLIIRDRDRVLPRESP